MACASVRQCTLNAGRRSEPLTPSKTPVRTRWPADARSQGQNTCPSKSMSPSGHCGRPTALTIITSASDSFVDMDPAVSDVEAIVVCKEDNEEKQPAASSEQDSCNCEKQEQSASGDQHVQHPSCIGLFDRGLESDRPNWPLRRTWRIFGLVGATASTRAAPGECGSPVAIVERASGLGGEDAHSLCDGRWGTPPSKRRYIWPLTCSRAIFRSFLQSGVGHGAA